MLMHLVLRSCYGGHSRVQGIGRCVDGRGGGGYDLCEDGCGLDEYGDGGDGDYGGCGGRLSTRVRVGRRRRRYPHPPHPPAHPSASVQLLRHSVGQRRQLFPSLSSSSSSCCCCSPPLPPEYTPQPSSSVSVPL